MKYEYKIEIVRAKTLRVGKLSTMQHLNALGEEGWELVSVTPREFIVLGSGVTYDFFLCFKRATSNVPTKFEYKVEVANRNETSKTKGLDHFLNSFNRDGWEYLSSVPLNYYLWGCGMTWLLALFFIRTTPHLPS